MNALELVNRVQRRLPGYALSEYLDEVNEAYGDVWDKIIQLDDSYYTDTQVVTVVQPLAEFDFRWNWNGGLSAPVSNRYFQIDRIRVLQPGGSNWFAAQPRFWNDQQFLMLQQLTPQQPAQNAPYLYQLFSRGSVLFSNPLPIGSRIEVVYTFVYIPLNLTTQGTITNTTSLISGAGTAFTQIIKPDFANALPNIDTDSDIECEFVFGINAIGTPVPQNSIYKVKNIQNDTMAQSWAPLTPNASATNFTLAMVPDIPESHHRVISTVATRNIMSTPGNDPRFAQWAAMAEEQMIMLQDSIMQRQRQQPARRQRFSQSVLRYQIAPPGR